VMADGYASIVRRPGHNVHGVLWQLTPRDLDGLIALNSWRPTRAAKRIVLLIVPGPGFGRGRAAPQPLLH
jgi:hypothetical protein